MTRHIKTIIIDDEPLARQIIRRFLEKWTEIEIVDECGDGFEAFKSINKYNPELIFLDIQMPRVNGFELLEILDNPPQIIFSTAHDEYALKAFELNAADYLLKPYTSERFSKAVEKVMSKFESGALQGTQLKEEPEHNAEELNRVVVKQGSHVEIIPADTIIYIEAADDYVLINTPSNKYIKQKTMKYYAQNLPQDLFVRIHRSYIINIEQIDRIEPYTKDDYQILLKSGITVPASRNGYKTLREKLNF